MVAILKHVGMAGCDRERLNMSVNRPAGWRVYACSEDVARDAIWAGNLAKVNTFNCLTHLGHGEGEPTVLGSTVLSLSTHRADNIKSLSRL